MSETPTTRKRMVLIAAIALIVTVIVVIVAVVVLSGDDEADDAETADDSLPPISGTYTIGVIDPDEQSARIDGLREGLAELGYADENLAFIYEREAPPTAEGVAALAEQVDLLVCTVESACRVAGTVAGDVPLVALTPTDLLLPRVDVDETAPWPGMLDVLERAMPGIERLVVVYNPDDPDAAVDYASIEAASGAEILSIDVRSVDEAGEVVYAVPLDVQALVVISDENISQGALEPLSEFARDVGVPLVSSEQRYGVLASMRLEPELIGVAAAPIVDHLLRGGAVSDVPPATVALAPALDVSVARDFLRLDLDPADFADVTVLGANASGIAAPYRVGFLAPREAEDEILDWQTELDLMQTQSPQFRTVLYDSVDQLESRASHLLARQPDVILCVGTSACNALAEIDAEVPVVFMDVDESFIQTAETLPRFTGARIRSRRYGEMALNVLTEFDPTLTQVAVLMNPSDPVDASLVASIQGQGAALGVEVTTFEADGPEAAIAALEDLEAAGLIVVPAYDEATVEALSAVAIERGIPMVVPQLAPTALFGIGVDDAGRQQQALEMANDIGMGMDAPLADPEPMLSISLITAEAMGIELPDALVRQAASLYR